ncbi:MAG: LTA synthase family protein [Gammaproteobacteria bacterium]|nr:LTA synthase family protein [Gammaproteobacteria bacterium]
MYFRNNFLHPLRVILAPLGLIVLFLSLSRVGFSAWQFERVQEVGQYGFIFIQGLRFDLVLLAMVMIFPATLTPLFATHLGAFKYWRKFLLIYMTAWFVFIAFMELSTPSFINQYDSRPNYIFIEYLTHYKEVAETLLAEYPLQLLLAVVVVPLASRFFYKCSQRLLVLEQPIKWVPALLLVPLLFISFVMAGRSTLDHRAVNPGTVALTTDHLVNDLALNSAYTLLYAVYLSGRDEEGGVPYGKMPFEQVVNTLRDEMGVERSAFTNPQLPSRHFQQSSMPRNRPLNLVIVLEESLGAEFVGKLGGLPLTPNLDALADEGIWFNNLYATGTRSVRGIEAVISGFLPTPGRSVVKLNKSQRDFFTLASFMKEQGYDTGFIYGGEGHFDNMRSFFMGNGFNYTIDQNDYPNTAFKATWGVSDEDLFDMADQKLSSYGDKPFFTVVFSSSNHSPFEFPDDRIEQYDEKKQTVNNAVKYADYALGRFIAKAKQSNYWDNTLFLVIADHNSRVYGSSLVPVDRFHIPALILGGPVKQAEVVNTLASQIDIGPTLLSMIGLSGEHPMVGRDLTLPRNRNRPGRAIMQFNKTLAFMEGEDVVVLQQNLPSKWFKYSGRKLIEQAGSNDTLHRKALAYSLFAQKAYAEKLYH